jgi:hypothetical protein
MKNLVVLNYRCERNCSAATLRKKLFCCNAAKKIVEGFNLPPRETILLMLEPIDKPGTYVQGEFRSIGRTIMTKRRLLVVTSAIGLVFAAIPASIKLSPANMTSLSLLSLDAAEARIGRPLTPLSVAGVHRRAHRRAYHGTGVGVVGAGAVTTGAYVAGAAPPAYPEWAPSFVTDAVQVEPGFNATVTDPATGRRCTISTSGDHWCWTP